MAAITISNIEDKLKARLPILELLRGHIKSAAVNVAETYITTAYSILPYSKTHRRGAVTATAA